MVCATSKGSDQQSWTGSSESILIKMSNCWKSYVTAQVMIVPFFEKMSPTVKPVLRGHSKIHQTKILMINGILMKVRSIAKYSNWSILQYFWPALSDNWSSKPIFGLFESGRFRQVYCNVRWVCSVVRADGENAPYGRLCSPYVYISEAMMKNHIIQKQQQKKILPFNISIKYFSHMLGPAFCLESSPDTLQTVLNVSGRIDHDIVTL